MKNNTKTERNIEGKKNFNNVVDETKLQDSEKDKPSNKLPSPSLKGKEIT